MENNCYFVCSRGILKSCDFHSLNPCSSWSYDVEHLIQMINGKNMFDNMSIYVCTDALPFFIYEILPKITNTFFLVSGDSDAMVPKGIIDLWNNPRELNENDCLRIINHPKLIKWFAQNCIFTKEFIESLNNHKVYLNSDKITQLPIGLDYHTISSDPTKFWRHEHEGNTTKYQEMILKNIRNNMKSFKNRIQKIFVHMTNTCDRQDALEQIPNDVLEINTTRMPRTPLWNEIAKYAFAFSPQGAGLDCHRTWEVLSLGCIPIIKSFGSNEMFNDLPILIVNEWGDINKELLDETIKKFSERHFNYEKLLLKYWVDQFSSPPTFTNL